MNTRNIKTPLIFAGLAAVGLTAGASSCINNLTGPGDAETIGKAAITACTVYGNIYAGINLADQLHPFSPAVVAKINAIDVTVEGICPPKGVMPASVGDAIWTVLTSTTQLQALIKQ